MTRSANLAFKFVLELAALAALAIWGASLSGSVVPVVVAIAAPLAMALVWGVWCAPRASRRLPMPVRAVVELGVFALAALALAAAGHVVWAVALAAATALNAALLTTFDQWEG
ncbi:MAG TPA: YrdB family protein [Kofleriaceae bacterium]|jgi:hypothetical protein|nr:YrdB family protein [Kofleriaceae bacterium]